VAWEWSLEGPGDKARVSKLQRTSGYAVFMKPHPQDVFINSHKVHNIQTQVKSIVQMTDCIGRKSPQHDRSHASEQSCGTFRPNLRSREGKGRWEEGRRGEGREDIIKASRREGGLENMHINQMNLVNIAR